MLKFGDVIEYENQYYVYLAKKDDTYTYYLAKIISDPEKVSEFLSYKKKFDNLPQTLSPQKENQVRLITCFITLESEEFSKQLAYFGNPDNHSVNFSYIYQMGSIESNDATNLKTEILQNPAVLPPPLLKAVRQMNENETIEENS